MATVNPPDPLTRALSAGEAEFRELADFAPVLIWRSGPDKLCDWFNRPWLEFTGRTLEQELGYGWADGVHPDDLERCVGIYTSHFDRRVPFSMEYRLRRHDGEYRWVLDNGAPFYRAGEFAGYFGSCIDVTDGHLALAATRARARQLLLVADAVPALISYVDAGQRYRFINRTYEEWFGRPRDEVVGRHLRDVLGEEAYAELAPLVARALCGERLSVERRLTCKDGGPRDVRVDYVPERSGDGTVAGYYALIQDIGEQKRTEEALRQLNETLESRVAARTRELEAVLDRLRAEIVEREAAEDQLRQAQKMDAVGQLTGGIAHDFNNLLTPIIGNLDLLRARFEGEERTSRQVGAALQAAERAAMLVQRLLAFARKQGLQPRAVDIGELLDGMRDLLSRSIGPRVTVAFDVGPGLPPAHVDPNQLELAILNLAVNARDAMPDGGRITVSVREEVVEAGAPAGLKPGQYLKLAIADAGEGMDAETLRRATEPFFSTKGAGKGTGLGLSMVHGLAAQSGGALRLSSAPGQGTTVDLWLPVAATLDAAGAHGIEREGEAAGRDGGGLHVLLVDDEELVRAGTADMLGDLGHQVVEANSAEAALEQLRGGMRPDILLTDHLMPGMTGAQLALEARRIHEGLPVLLITGFADLHGEEAAGLPRLAKPFRQGELVDRLDGLLRPDRRSGGRA